MTEPFVLTNIPDNARRAVQDWIARSHITRQADSEIIYTDIPSPTGMSNCLACFTGAYDYDFRLQLFVVACWHERLTGKEKPSETWHVSRINELFISALSGEMRRVIATWPHHESEAGE